MTALPLPRRGPVSLRIVILCARPDRRARRALAEITGSRLAAMSTDARRLDGSEGLGEVPSTPPARGANLLHHIFLLKDRLGAER